MKDKKTTIKVWDIPHRELKIFVANNPDTSMVELASSALMKELDARGHKFSTPKANRVAWSKPVGKAAIEKLKQSKK